MAMLADLRFCDERLEARFERQLAVNRRSTVAGFSTFRTVMLTCCILRALAAGRWWSPEMLFIVGAASNLVPYLAVQRSSKGRSRGWKWLAVLTDVLQAAVGCYNHPHTAPSHEGIAPAASLVYLPFGSAALWMLCYSTFSHLPFWLELIKTAAVSAVLLGFSKRLCRGSPGLRRAYSTLHTGMQTALRRCQQSATYAALLAGGQGQLPGAGAPAGEAAEPLGTAVCDDTRLCSQYQVAVVVLSAVAAVWAVYRTERRLRFAFLRQYARLSGGQLAQLAAHDAGEAAVAVAAAEAWADEAESGSATSDLDFLLGFGAPAALGMLMIFSMEL